MLVITGTPKRRRSPVPRIAWTVPGETHWSAATKTTRMMSGTATRTASRRSRSRHQCPDDPTHQEHTESQVSEGHQPSPGEQPGTRQKDRAESNGEGYVVE